MSTQNAVTFEDPKQYRNFLDLSEKKVVVFHGDTAENEYDYRGRRNVTRKHPYFKALVTYEAQLYTAMLGLTPAAPKGWCHGTDQTIRASEENKLDFVKFLGQQPGIDLTVLGKLDKVKVKQIKEFLDSSKDLTEEHTCKKTGEANQEFDIGSDLGVLHVVIEKNNASLSYSATTDFSAAWKATEDAARQQLSGLTILTANFDIAG